MWDEVLQTVLHDPRSDLEQFWLTVVDGKYIPEPWQFHSTNLGLLQSVVPVWLRELRRVPHSLSFCLYIDESFQCHVRCKITNKQTKILKNLELSSATMYTTRHH